MSLFIQSWLSVKSKIISNSSKEQMLTLQNQANPFNPDYAIAKIDYIYL